MSDYIKREDVNRVFENIRTRYARLSMLGAEDLICKAHDLIDEIPAADVRENVRGEWVLKQNYYPSVDQNYNLWVCSKCGYERSRGWEQTIEGRKPTALFCEICGADVRGGVNDG